jgi:hypothetical protein
LQKLSRIFVDAFRSSTIQSEQIILQSGIHIEVVSINKAIKGLIDESERRCNINGVFAPFGTSPMISVAVPPAPTDEASSISPSFDDHSSYAELLIKQFATHLVQSQ